MDAESVHFVLTHAAKAGVTTGESSNAATTPPSTYLMDHSSPGSAHTGCSQDIPDSALPTTATTCSAPEADPTPGDGGMHAWPAHERLPGTEQAGRNQRRAALRVFLVRTVPRPCPVARRFRGRVAPRWA